MSKRSIPYLGHERKVFCQFPYKDISFVGAGAWLILIRGRFPHARRAFIILAPEADSKKTWSIGRAQTG